jgi:pimeloyl-ACP methyl ester carboxylesterase
VLSCAAPLFNLFKKLCILAPAIFFLFCQKQNAMPPDAAQQFGRWFVSASPALYDSLVSYKMLGQKQDSLAAIAKKNFEGACGKFTIVLPDTFGSRYTIGWKTPAIIRRDTLYPLIVYLHGGTGTMLTTKGEIAWDMLSALGDTFNLFLASPSANRENPWWSPAGISRILQTVRFMTLSYPVNPDKIFLAGVSDGAAGCYAAANTICSPFAGFIAVSGFGGMLVQLGMDLYPGNIMQRPILNINAGKDQIYPIEEVRKYLDWLTANGVSIERKEYPEEKHGFDYREKEYGHLAGFIRTWSRPNSSRAVSWTFVRGFPNCPDNLLRWDFSQNASERTINAYWTKDTLQVRSAGIRNATISFSGNGPQKINLRLYGTSSVQRVSAVSPGAPLFLCMVLHGLFPRVSTQTVYTFQLP